MDRAKDESCYSQLLQAGRIAVEDSDDVLQALKRYDILRQHVAKTVALPFGFPQLPTSQTASGVRLRGWILRKTASHELSWIHELFLTEAGDVELPAHDSVERRSTEGVVYLENIPRALMLVLRNPTSLKLQFS